MFTFGVLSQRQLLHFKMSVGNAGEIKSPTQSNRIGAVASMTCQNVRHSPLPHDAPPLLWLPPLSSTQESHLVQLYFDFAFNF